MQNCALWAANQSRRLCWNRLPTNEQILRDNLAKRTFALCGLVRTAGDNPGGTNVDGWEGNWQLISLIASNKNHTCRNKVHRYNYTPAGGTQKRISQIQKCALRAANQSHVLCTNKLPTDEQIFRNKLPKYGPALYGQQIRAVCSAETNCQQMNKYSEIWNSWMVRLEASSRITSLNCMNLCSFIERELDKCCKANRSNPWQNLGLWTCISLGFMVFCPTYGLKFHKV